MAETPIRGKRILLVDDEQLVRASLGMMLELDSHQVVQAQDALQALGQYGPGKFDLVITDWKMPGMPGDELSARTKEICPSQRVLMITAHDPEIQDFHPDAILHKPFTRSELRAAVARALS